MYLYQLDHNEVNLPSYLIGVHQISYLIKSAKCIKSKEVFKEFFPDTLFDGDARCVKQGISTRPLL